MTRICKLCNIEKQLDGNFFKRSDTSGANVYRWQCKACCNVQNKNGRLKQSCKYQNCVNKVVAKNMCSTHYYNSFNGTKTWHKDYYRTTKGKLSAKTCSARRRDKFSKCNKFLKETKDFYKHCPKGVVVDHIVPITNSDICGLHVPWNLQYLTKSENSKKRNKFDFTYDNRTWQQTIIVENETAAKRNE